jgi:regulator of RNase E activity RraA
MKTKLLLLITLGAISIQSAFCQTISKEELIFLTSEWQGERFPDGRPKISDDLINRAKKIGIEEAWQVLNNEGYTNQYEGNWKTSNGDVQVFGRAVTARFIPTRPDLDKNITERGHKSGFNGASNSWPISVLQKGDVYVADCFGKINEGTLIGDNLGNAIFSRTGTGVVFDGAARDMQGLAAINGFNAYVRDFHPSFLKSVILIGLNTPIRIGAAVVLPGDLVMSEGGGVLFIPAHMAEKVILTAEFVSIRDKFSHERLKQGRYNAGQIDSQWTNEIIEDFMKWLGQHPELQQLTRSQVDEFMKKRTW